MSSNDSTPTSTPTPNSTDQTIIQNVKEYYGQDLKTNADLKTSACCLGEGEEIKLVSKLLKNIHKDILDKFYGCGSPIPPLLTNVTTLDLGCGTGRDTYICSQLVGPNGLCIGVDMTEEQLEVATQYEIEQSKKFGYTKPNTLFIHGDISNLKKAGIKDNSIDVVISNCVLNLAPSKENVLKEIYRVLKPGGELYFSDVYSDRRIPLSLQQDKILWGECLSGALYKQDFQRIMERVGFSTYWIVNSRVLSIDDNEIKQKVGKITFFSETIRAFKINFSSSTTNTSTTNANIYGVPNIQDILNEDYGQTAKYNGSIEGFPHAFSLGNGQIFITDQKTPVDGYLAYILSNSRYSSAFTITSPKEHRGTFGGNNSGNRKNINTIMESSNDDDNSSSTASCCPPSKKGCC